MTKQVKIIVAILCICATLGIASSFYFYSLTREVETRLGESDKVIAQIGQLILLPEGEIPTVATVDDLELLRDQAFFANAELGDKVLIYNKAKKAFLFRPSQGKIIEVSGITIDVDVTTDATTQE